MAITGYFVGDAARLYGFSVPKASPSRKKAKLFTTSIFSALLMKERPSSIKRYVAERFTCFPDDVLFVTERLADPAAFFVAHLESSAEVAR